MIDNFISNLQEGIYHIININAYDHFLFLTVLLIPYTFKDWKRIALLITVFTIGHIMSLSLAAYDIISVNNTLIHFLVPLIISVLAILNIFTAGKKLHQTKIGLLLLITLFFGLVHGLGFKNHLNSLISVSEHKFLAILEIALGIQIGQLIIGFIVVFLSFLCQTIFRFSKRDWVLVISSIVLGCVLPILIRSKLLS